MTREWCHSNHKIMLPGKHTYFQDSQRARILQAATEGSRNWWCFSYHTFQGQGHEDGSSGRDCNYLHPYLPYIIYIPICPYRHIWKTYWKSKDQRRCWKKEILKWKFIKAELSKLSTNPGVTPWNARRSVWNVHSDAVSITQRTKCKIQCGFIVEWAFICSQHHPEEKL